MKTAIIKETRGRPKKYDFGLKKNEYRIYPRLARSAAMKYAINNGYKFRTWVENDLLHVVRVK